MKIFQSTCSVSRENKRKMQRYRDSSKDENTRQSLGPTWLMESKSSTSMGKFGSLRTYKNDSWNGTTMSFNTRERIAWSTQLVRLLRGKDSQQVSELMMTPATVANATNTQTRKRTESYPLSQLCGTKSPGRQSTSIVEVHGQFAI